MNKVKTCAIMQPHFMPWMGYFNLIRCSDIFIFLDDAQFEKQSWQNRNRLLVNNAEFWLSAPIIKHPLIKKINETRLDVTRNWHQKTLMTLHNTYKKREYFFQIEPILEIFEKEDDSLLNLNLTIINLIVNALNLDAKFFLSSEFNVEGVRTEKLINLLDKVQAKKYLSPLGSKEYLEQDNFLSKTDCELEFQNFNSIKYNKISSVASNNHLSIIHYLANYSFEDIINELII